MADIVSTYKHAQESIKNLSAAAGGANSSASVSSSSSGAKKWDSSHTIPGPDGKWYETTTKMLQATGFAKGGIVPPGLMTNDGIC